MIMLMFLCLVSEDSVSSVGRQLQRDVLEKTKGYVLNWFGDALAVDAMLLKCFFERGCGV